MGIEWNSLRIVSTSHLWSLRRHSLLWTLLATTIARARTMLVVCFAYYGEKETQKGVLLGLLNKLRAELEWTFIPWYRQFQRLLLHFVFVIDIFCFLRRLGWWVAVWLVTKIQLNQFHRENN